MALGTQPQQPKYFNQPPSFSAFKQPQAKDSPFMDAAKFKGQFDAATQSGNMTGIWDELSAKAKNGDQAAAFRLSQIAPMYNNYMSQVNQGKQLASTPQSSFGSPTSFGPVQNVSGIPVAPTRYF